MMSMHRVVNAHDRDYDQQCCGSSRDYKRLGSGPARIPMNKRLLKRHKRQVSRAKAGTRLSEPGRADAGTGKGGKRGKPRCHRSAYRCSHALLDAPHPTPG